MNDDQALAFLRQHQPLPDDENLTEGMIRQYDEARRHFITAPNLAAIPLFLNSFGEGSGFGVYQLVEDVLASFADEEVLPSLLKSLDSEYCGVRYWSAQIAANYTDERLISPLLRLLNDDSADARVAALTALENFPSSGLLNRLRERSARESDTDVKDMYAEVIAGIAGKLTGRNREDLGDSESDLGGNS